MKSTILKIVVAVVAMGLSHAVVANGIGDFVFLDCTSVDAEEHEALAYGGNVCYRAELTCGYGINGFMLMGFDSFYGSWFYDFQFLGAEDSGACGTNLGQWRAMTDQWSTRCVFDGEEVEVRVKSINVKNCLHD